MSKKIGRPTLLTPELQDQLCEAIKHVRYNSVACDLCQVHTDTLRLWMRRADEGDEDYIPFSNAFKKAKAEAVKDNLSTIQKASTGSWQAAAWLLERTNNQMFGQNQKPETSELRITVVHENYVEGEFKELLQLDEGKEGE